MDLCCLHVKSNLYDNIYFRTQYVLLLKEVELKYLVLKELDFWQAYLIFYMMFCRWANMTQIHLYEPCSEKVAKCIYKKYKNRSAGKGQQADKNWNSDYLPIFSCPQTTLRHY